MIIGCGWTPEVEETTGWPCPELGNNVPCAARGEWYNHAKMVGAVGLCLGCIESPSDLLLRVGQKSDHHDGGR